MNNNQEYRACSLCHTRREPKNVYKNPICGHNYCSICIQKRHIPNKDYIACFYYTCQKLVEVNALDNYFFDSMTESIPGFQQTNKKQEQSAKQQKQQLSDIAFKNIYSQSNQAGGQIEEEKTQYPQSTKEFSEANVSDKQRIIKDNSLKSMDEEKSIVNVDSGNRVKQNFYQEYPVIKRIEINIQDTKQLCGKCLCETQEVKNHVNTLICKTHKTCLCCSIKSIYLGKDENCTICSNWISYKHPRKQYY